MAPSHLPVLVREVVQFLKCRAGGVYVDCTVGEGGHTLEILKAIEPDGRIIGLDRDRQSIERSRQRLMSFANRVSLHHENFVRLDAVLEQEGIQMVDGFLFDLGLSSVQLEDEGRGFSFQKEGPLDMRMDQTSDVTASDLVNQLDEVKLAAIFQEYGEERWSKKISRIIVQERKKASIATTSRLVEVILKAVPARYRTGKIHPATRVFQALRIAVNDELSVLRLGLEAAVGRLKHCGRLCVIAFHSLEDRIVKHRFREWESQGQLKVITKRPVVPSVEEKSLNPRCRSAKLRVAERNRSGEEL
jgi:16S rRNA (cytosine1402-N4)-methyltransferase